MKKNIFLIIMIAFLFLIAYSSGKEKIDIKDGTYYLEQIERESIMVPSVTIKKESISFSYDMLSSYFAIGQYTVEKDILTMTTNDNIYKYVFKIDGNQLIFKANESSEVKLIDARLGLEIKDNAVFKLVEE